jgi:hypothetical protein
LGKPSGSPGKLERALSRGIGHFQQVHAATLLTRRAREFEVEIFGSANMPKFEASLLRGDAK